MNVISGIIYSLLWDRQKNNSKHYLILICGEVCKKKKKLKSIDKYRSYVQKILNREFSVEN